MPRPRIDLGQQAQGALSASQRPRTTTAGTDGRLLTSARSARYAAAVAKLDGSATLTEVQTARIVDDIHREFAEKWAAFPAGIVGHCFLGAPFEVHTLTADGQIVEHYQVGEPLPGLLEKARSLARHDTYLAIEVYPDRMVCVRHDGTITILGAD